MRVLEVLVAVMMLAPSGQARTAQAQEAGDADEAAVRAALQHYLAGHATGRGEHFDTAFHDVANLYWIDDGVLRTRTSAAYIAGAGGSPAPDESERERRIAWVDVTGDAAVARIDLDYPGVFITDYMSLLKVEGEWQIVGKIFHVDRRGPEARTERSALGDDRRQIEAAGRAFSSAYVAGDTASLRDLYTVDAVLLPPEREIRGRDGVGRYFAPSPRSRNLAHALRSDEVRIFGETAVDIGEWSNTWQVGENAPREASGRYLVVWRKGSDGRWRMAYDMWHRPVE